MARSLSCEATSEARSVRGAERLRKINSTPRNADDADHSPKPSRGCDRTCLRLLAPRNSLAAHETVAGNPTTRGQTVARAPLETRATPAQPGLDLATGVRRAGLRTVVDSPHRKSTPQQRPASKTAEPGRKSRPFIHSGGARLTRRWLQDAKDQGIDAKPNPASHYRSLQQALASLPVRAHLDNAFAFTWQCR